jgi:hypothetical protein
VSAVQAMARASDPIPVIIRPSPRPNGRNESTMPTWPSWQSGNETVTVDLSEDTEDSEDQERGREEQMMRLWSNPESLGVMSFPPQVEPDPDEPVLPDWLTTDLDGNPSNFDLVWNPVEISEISELQPEITINSENTESQSDFGDWNPVATPEILEEYQPEQPETTTLNSENTESQTDLPNFDDQLLIYTQGADLVLRDPRKQWTLAEGKKSCIRRTLKSQRRFTSRECFCTLQVFSSSTLLRIDYPINVNGIYMFVVSSCMDT